MVHQDDRGIDTLIPPRPDWLIKLKQIADGIGVSTASGGMNRTLNAVQRHATDQPLATGGFNHHAQCSDDECGIASENFFQDPVGGRQRTQERAERGGRSQ